MNLLNTILPKELIRDILLDPRFENRDLIQFGRVSKICYTLTADQILLKKLFPFENLFSKGADLRRFVFNYTFTSENELLSRIKHIVSQLAPRQSLNVQASFVNAQFTPYMMNLINSGIFSRGSYFKLTDVSKITSILNLNTVNISGLFANLADVKELTPAFRYRINKDHDNCIRINFFFRNAFRPQNYSMDLKNEFLRISQKYHGVIDASAIRFTSNDSLTLQYFNAEYTPHVFITDEDLVLFEKFIVKIYDKILRNLTDFASENINTFEDLKTLCNESKKEDGGLMHYSLLEDDILKAVEEPEILEMFNKIKNRLDVIGDSIKKLESQNEESVLTPECKDLIKFSVKQFEPHKDNIGKSILGFFITVLIMNYFNNGEISLEGMI
ncbi:MAG: hypothetical protein H0U49_03435 [Parachlamydiaceae bacterium]|nr:hypothetical protein [Parachlamydiaceae bacterium]